MQKDFNYYMQDNVMFIQCISTRDKISGKYLPLMDGNINVTLNRIYANQHKLESVIITLPLKKDIDDNQMSELVSFCASNFTTPIRFNHIPYYSPNIEESRKLIMKSQYGINDFVDWHLLAKKHTIICDFPINISTLQPNIDVVYNYNWSYCSSDEKSETLKDLHFNEKLLALHRPTFLYSDVQYDFWKDTIDSDAFELMKVQRSKSIFSREYVNLVSQWEVNKAQQGSFSLNILEYHSLHHILENENVVFYPSRIEDERYKFDNVIKLAKANNKKIIITNPTNYDMNIVYAKHPQLQSSVIDLSSYNEFKRILYFYILSKLKSSDDIYHFEKDMHISLIEQIMLTKANMIIPYISNQQINSYINE